MSSAFDIQGRNCIFQMLIGDTYMDVVCAKTFSFNRVYELKETTTVASGYDKEYRPRKKSYTISFNGVVQVIAESDKPTLKTLFDYAEQFLPVNYRLIYEDNSGNVLVIVGQCYANGAIFNANPINLLDGTTELTGNGPIEILDEVPDFINVTVAVEGVADAKCRFLLFDADGNIKYDTSTIEALLPYSGWIPQGVSVVIPVQKGQYAWGVSTDDIFADLSTFDLDITPAVNINIPYGDYSQNSLPDVYDFLIDKTATFTIGLPVPPPVCVPPAIVGIPALPDAVIGEPYTYSFSVNGSTTFNLSNITKPAWLNISIISVSTSGCVISMTGTPGVGDDGVGILVSFDINNACGTASFSDTIVVSTNPDLIIINYTFTDNLPSSSVFRIYKNGIAAIAPLTASGAGSINAVPGDVLQVSVTEVGGTKNIVVNDSVSGDIYNVTNGNTTNSFSWTAVLGSDYTITATIS